MAITQNNPDPLQDQKRLRIRSEAFGEEFVFKRLTGRDREKIDDLVWEYCGGKMQRMTVLSQGVYNAAATLQVALVAPSPATEANPTGYSFIDQEDADWAVMDLCDKYREWRDRFRKVDPAGAGKPGGAEQSDARVAVPAD